MSVMCWQRSESSRKSEAVQLSDIAGTESTDVLKAFRLGEGRTHLATTLIIAASLLFYVIQPCHTSSLPSAHTHGFTKNGIMLEHGGKQRHDSLSKVTEKPYFDDVSPRNLTAIVGQSIVLRCRVKNLGNRTVSWMRRRDLHILTSSIITYTGDDRFSVRHPMDTDDWDLRVDYVQKRDEDTYDCQVNTEPKISLPVRLIVEDASTLAAKYPAPKLYNNITLNSSDAQASIWGPQEVFVKKGSTISLTCSVTVHSSPPTSVQWYHGRSVVDFDSPRGGISLETEKSEQRTTSKLLLTKAMLSDSGNYTCRPLAAHPASVIVHVLNGEHPAAMQTGCSTCIHLKYSSKIVTILWLVTLLLSIWR